MTEILELGPWHVVTYNNGYENRETVQNVLSPLKTPMANFNTEVGHGQREADFRNAAYRALAK